VPVKEFGINAPITWNKNTKSTGKKLNHRRHHQSITSIRPKLENWKNVKPKIQMRYLKLPKGKDYNSTEKIRLIEICYIYTNNKQFRKASAPAPLRLTEIYESRPDATAILA
jgi:hypothetical protein